MAGTLAVVEAGKQWQESDDGPGGWGENLVGRLSEKARATG